MILTRRIGISIDNGLTLNQTKTRRTLIVPNQAIATYVTQWTYDSHNRLVEMIYPDEEKVTYSYNLGGLLEKVRGEKSYGYDYITKLGYDKFEQRIYLKYCNGAETFYTYDNRRRLSNLAVNSGGASIMDNAYTFDAVSNVLSVANNASLPANGNAGGQMSHTYTYDGLYRLATATGTYTGADNKSASYTLAMGYDNMHRIKSKSQHLTQDNVQFNGTLNVGYDLTYTYSSEAGKKFQLESVKDVNYRTEETPEGQQVENGHIYQYDKNGNLIYVNTNRVMTDGHRDNSVGERKLIWDEENRLLAVDDNGFVSNYWYDADGERTVKTSGESDQVYVNGVFSGGSTNTAKFSLYVSPYLVANQGGRYTKHIYAGSQRIVSKVGDFASYGSDPRRIEYAGANTDGLSVDYKSKYAAQQQVIKDNYKFFDVPYNGTDNDNYADGEGFCCNDGSMEAAVAEARKAQTRAVSRSFKDPDNYENLQFFYHPDHLGSSSFITNLDGEVVQHIEYVPFGEVFIEERNNVWNTPYLFNAKEFDEETGLYYYGARYYDPRISIWISTDQLQETTPNCTSYLYCMGNPIIFIDIDGRDGKTRVYGAIRLIGGIFQTGGGVVLLGVPEPTMLTKVGGWIAVAHGADDIQAGFRELITGEPTNNVTQQAVKASAQYVGADESTAQSIANYTDLSLGFVGCSTNFYGADFKFAQSSASATKQVSLVTKQVTLTSRSVISSDETLKGVSGIYIHHFKSGRVYVGQASNLSDRPWKSLQELTTFGSRGTNKATALKHNDVYSHTELIKLEGSGFNSLNELEGYMIRQYGGTMKTPNSRTYNIKNAPATK